MLTSSSLHCVQASGKGRTGDSSPGEQDEIDIEWKGNTPQQLQTNVFLAGADEAKVRCANGRVCKTEGIQAFHFTWILYV